MATTTKSVKPVEKSQKSKSPAPKAAAKPAVKPVAKAMAAPPKPEATKTAVKKPTTRKPKVGAAPPSKGAVLTPEQRRCYVEVAAYYIAERRGFDGGGPLDDWTKAEAEIDRLLREGILKP